MRAALALLVFTFIAGCNRPSADDVKPVRNVLEAVATPTDMRVPLLYQGCSEIKSCAGGCDKAFHLSSDSSTDSAQRATLLAHCSADYRKRREAGEKLSADEWIEQHWRSYLDDVAKVVPEADRAAFDAARAKAKL
jgi:hypothetical protein